MFLFGEVLCSEVLVTVIEELVSSVTLKFLAVVLEMVVMLGVVVVVMNVLVIVVVSVDLLVVVVVEKVVVVDVIFEVVVIVFVAVVVVVFVVVIGAVSLVVVVVDVVMVVFIVVVVVVVVDVDLVVVIKLQIIFLSLIILSDPVRYSFKIINDFKREIGNRKKIIILLISVSTPISNLQIVEENNLVVVPVSVDCII